MRLVLFLALVLAAPIPAGAQEAVGGQVPPAARDVIDQTMSPFCPGLLLANCPSPSADSLRDAIVRRVEAGETPEAIRNDLIATYGDAVRASPQASGLGLVAWVMPALFLMAGAIFVTTWLRRARHRQAAVPGPAAGPDAGAAGALRDDEVARVRDLVRRDD